MDAKTCLKKLQLVGVLDFATVDESGNPQIRCISAIHFEEDRFFFYTARGKDFCRQLKRNGKVQILAYTRFKEMIRVSAVARPVDESEQRKYIDMIFAEQPYLENVYPDNTNEIGIIFVVDKMSVEYFNLGVTPIFREIYTVNGGTAKQKGFVITEKCIGCGTCIKNCPQKCIETGKPYKINPVHCLHCGNCFEKCPVKAIERL